MSVAIVNLGCANLASLCFALDRLEARYTVTSEAAVIAAADKVILPGVGSASYAADRIDELGLRSTLENLKQPLFGVCLGMQLLYETSAEGNANCLGRIAGGVERMTAPNNEPWPHMGWARVRTAKEDSRLLYGVDDDSYFYFVHGFSCPVGHESAGVADYGAPFTAVVETDNIYGCQFHPERSSVDGARVLKNFLDLPC